MGPNGAFHAYVNRIRSVELGVTTIRCSRYGISGVYDANHQIIAEKLTLDREQIVFHVPVMKRKFTVFF